MKVKNIIFLIVACVSSKISAEMVYHKMISIIEHKMLGHTFKHIMTSGSAEKDEYFIDGHAITQENYNKEFERIQKQEWQECALQQENQRRSRLQFAETVQLQVTSKLLHKIIVQVVDLLKRSSDPALEKFFVFCSATIDSIDQLHQLKIFVDQVQSSMKLRIENNDVEGLNLLYTKLECWPARLEKFFQDTIQQAIRQSDDTAMLKELLSFVSEPFGI